MMISPDEARELCSQAMEEFDEQKQDWINDSIEIIDSAIAAYAAAGERFVKIKITLDAMYGGGRKLNNQLELERLPNAYPNECLDALDLIGELYESEGYTVSLYERVGLFERIFGKKSRGCHARIAENKGGLPLWIQMQISW